MNKKRNLLKATILPLISLPLILTPVILTSCGNGQGGGQPTPYKKSFDASVLGDAHGTFELEITGTAAKFISFSEDYDFNNRSTINFNDGYISDPETGKRFTITELAGTTFKNWSSNLSHLNWNITNLVIPGCVQKIDSGFGCPKQTADPQFFNWKSITLEEGIKTIENNAGLSQDWMVDETGKVLPDDQRVPKWKSNTLNLPSTLEFVGEGAFGTFGQIFINKKNSIIADKPPFWSSIYWGISYEYGTVHVPQSLLNVYQNNWNWKTQLWDKGVTLVGDIQ